MGCLVLSGDKGELCNFLVAGFTEAGPQIFIEASEWLADMQV
jgi:hypothetical protein